VHKTVMDGRLNQPADRSGSGHLGESSIKLYEAGALQQVGRVDRTCRGFFPECPGDSECS
jgi:hypothetical protein